MKNLKQKHKTFFLAAIVLLTLSILSSCSSYSGNSLKIGITADHEPWEVKLENGESSGISVDLVTQFALNTNQEVEWVWLEKDEWFTALENHKVDMVLSSATVEDDRLDDYLISDPYAKVYDILLIGKSSSLIGKNEINAGQTKIAVIENSETEALIKSNYSSASITSFKSRQSAADAVSSGQCDAFADDPLSIMSLYALDSESYRINPAPLSDEFQYYVAYFHKDDEQLRASFNQFLFTVKKTDFYSELNDKYKKPLRAIMDLYRVDFIL